MKKIIEFLFGMTRIKLAWFLNEVVLEYTLNFSPKCSSTQERKVR